MTGAAGPSGETIISVFTAVAGARLKTAGNYPDGPFPGHGPAKRRVKRLNCQSPHIYHGNYQLFAAWSIIIGAGTGRERRSWAKSTAFASCGFPYYTLAPLQGALYPRWPSGDFAELLRLISDVYMYFESSRQQQQ